MIAWQKAKELSVLVYRCTAQLKDFGFTNQIQRAAVSSMNNIAEGFERRTIKDKVAFFYIAKGSAGEVRSMVILGLELGYVTKAQHDELIELSVAVVRLLSGLITAQPTT